MVNTNATFRMVASISALLFAVIMVSGGASCLGGGEGDTTTSSSYSYTTPPVFNPVGTIQGNLVDAVTNAPIVGAVVSVGLLGTTTDVLGQYVLANVPATKVVSATAGTIISHVYEVTIDLRSVNAGITGTNPKYPEYSYDTIAVEAAADPLVDHVISGKQLSVGKLAATITGVVAYTGTRQVVGSGWTVKLVSISNSMNSETSAVGGTGNTENIVGTATTDVSGAFSFTNIESRQSFRIDAWNSTGTYRGSELVASPSDGETRTMVIQHDNDLNDQRAVFVSPIDALDPEIINVYPESGADITPGNVDVFFEFSEPMSATAYALGLTASAVNGLYYDLTANFISTKSGNIPHTIAWNSTYTRLTITLSSLAASSEFTVSILGASLTDINNRSISNLALRGSVTFTTNGGTSVSAPTVTVNNSASLDEGGTTTPILDWAPVSGAKGYNVYRADNELWGGTTQAGTYIKINGAPVLASNYTDATLATYVENYQTKLTYSYIVKAYNSDYVESTASTVVTASDVLGSILSAVAIPAMALPADGATTTYTFTLTFNEEVDEATAETLTYYVVNDNDANADTVKPVITAVTYNVTTQQATLTATLTNPTAGTESYNGQWTLQLDALNIKDVSGNTMRTTGDAWNNQTLVIE